MYILMADNICMEPEILKIIYFAKEILNVIKIIVPILLIVLGMLDFLKAVIASDEQKMSEYKNKFVRRLFAAVLIFFIPSTVDFVFKNIDNTDIFNDACWNSAIKENISKIEEEARTRRNTEENERSEWVKKNLEKYKGKQNLAISKPGVSLGGSLVSSSGKDNNIVQYAIKFVGHPYKYGGNRLCENWAGDSSCVVDCSAFVQSIYKKFEYDIPRTASAQANAFQSVSLNELKPGDLLFYHNFGHVALYIGTGDYNLTKSDGNCKETPCVVHASNAKNGTIISKYNYNNIDKAVRIIK